MCMSLLVMHHSHDFVDCCRASKGESPHVVIDVHANSPAQQGPVEAVLAAQQQGTQQTSGPLPIVLDSQHPTASQDRQ